MALDLFRERLIGRDQDYVYAMGPHLLQSVLHPEDVERRARYMRELATLNDGNAIREMEFRVWNGEEFRWFRSRGSIFAHDKDRAKQVIGIAEDITYEKKFHEANNNDEDSAALN